MTHSIGSSQVLWIFCSLKPALPTLFQLHSIEDYLARLGKICSLSQTLYTTGLTLFSFHYVETRYFLSANR